jgi:hydrogenase-4 component B
MILFLAGLGLVLGGGMAVVLGRHSATGNRAYQLLVATGCGVAVIDPLRAVFSGEPASLALAATLPGGRWIVGLDPLSGVFLLAILFVGAASALFGTQYLAAEREGSSKWVPQLSFTVLVSAIALLVAARTVVLFLMAWEVMALSSYVLIVTNHQHADVRRAGLIYLVTTHAATLALFVMFAVWVGGGGDWSFDALARGAPALSTGSQRAVLGLALVGFGIKAGLVPFHFWLPPAHAAAPSHVSALMSGIVIKTGIYGLLRVLVLLGGAPAWWGWLILGLGATSGILGVLWALAQHDLKRLLAYHSVENIGIILMGAGVGALGIAYQNHAMAALGFSGALLHTVNHALFKSLLFLGAGAVYRATGTRNMETLGGLARRMPLTWLAFVVGATAIIGVPPLNGFVSEWLVFQGLWAAGHSSDGPRMALLGVPVLGLIGALALACFAKVAGVVFLGTPRTEAARAAEEREEGMLVPMLSLAAACVVLGVVPVLGLSITAGAAGQLSGGGGEGVPPLVTASAAAISWMALGTGALAAALWILRARLVGRSVRREPTWACAYPGVTPRMQYTASSFATPLLSVFGWLNGVRVERSLAALHTRSLDLVLDRLVLPLWYSLHRAALWLRPIQQGRLHLYVLYVMAALLALLAYLSFEVLR